MNTWERIEPGASQTQERGYAIYRATLRPPKVVQSRGGEIVFHALAGAAEIYLDGELRASANEGGKITIALPAGVTTVTISVLILATAAPTGLIGLVEIVPN